MYYDLKKKSANYTQVICGALIAFSWCQSVKDTYKPQQMALDNAASFLSKTNK